ncbi:hypothetical protein RC083_10900 [Pseudoalteromonas haloplanktis]|uniref:Lipoprotein n=1 Tax=Pseudoalteromonas haloplanktis TaxID=228 RepID=A0ABU1BCK1_PSEHA|nr:hypothetical protein [Pseudoalteromonas haloplanktis]MDQ9092095.1 hypothetical protein [Pseudoalteromonas haloplanktis]
MKKLLFLSAIALSLSGCNLDNDPTEEELTHEYLSDHVGLYETAYELEGHAMLARLAVSDLGATLVLTNDMEVSISLSAEVVDQNLEFASQQSCTDVGSGFSCTLTSQTINLARIDTRHYTAVNQLAGDYRVIAEEQVVDINLDSQGTFVAQFQGCNITGTISTENTFFSVTPAANSCGSEHAVGVAFSNNYEFDPTSLEVYLPGSVLSGEWVKM